MCLKMRLPQPAGRYSRDWESPVRASTCTTTENENQAQSRSKILAQKRRKGWDEVAVGMETYSAQAENWQGSNKGRRTDCTQGHTSKQQGVGAEPEARAP